MTTTCHVPMYSLPKKTYSSLPKYKYKWVKKINVFDLNFESNTLIFFLRENTLIFFDLFLFIFWDEKIIYSVVLNIKKKNYRS